MNNNYNNHIHCLGARGTIPTGESNCMKYGNATSSYLLRFGGEVILLDGGTGLVNLHHELLPEEKKMSFFLSHPHVDHLLGIPICVPFLNPQFKITLYSARHMNLAPIDQIRKLMSPPLWPVGPEIFSGFTAVKELDGEPIQLGEVLAETFALSHPGGCTAFRFTWKDQLVVYATDVELGIGSMDALEDFCRGATLLLMDGQYFGEEILKTRGFGHSTWQEVADFAQRCEVKKLAVIHHAPGRTDAELDAEEEKLPARMPNSLFVRQGEKINV